MQYSVRVQFESSRYTSPALSSGIPANLAPVGLLSVNQLTSLVMA